MQLKNFLLALSFAGIAFSAQVQASSTWDMKTIHIEAKETTAFNGGRGVDVPKVYVLDTAGKITYENNPDKPQSSGPVVKALQDSSPITAKDQDVLSKLLQAHKVDVSSSKTKTLVTLEFGDSVGRCPGCDILYPAVEKDVTDATIPSFTWVHVKMEKNGYKN